MTSNLCYFTNPPLQVDDYTYFINLAADLRAGTPFIFFCKDLVKAATLITTINASPDTKKLYVNDQIVLAPALALVKNQRKKHLSVCSLCVCERYLQLLQHSHSHIIVFSNRADLPHFRPNDADKEVKDVLFPNKGAVSTTW